MSYLVYRDGRRWLELKERSVATGCARRAVREGAREATVFSGGALVDRYLAASLAEDYVVYRVLDEAEAGYRRLVSYYSTLDAARDGALGAYEQGGEGLVIEGVREGPQGDEDHLLELHRREPGSRPPFPQPRGRLSFLAEDVTGSLGPARLALAASI